LRQAVVIFIDSPFHKESAKNIIKLHNNSSIIIYHVRLGLGYIEGHFNIVNSQQNWTALSFVNQSLQTLVERLKDHRSIKLYTFYETSYHFLYVKSALNIEWKNVVIFDDGIGSCFKHAMPKRYRLLLQTLLLKMRYNITVPFSRFSLGNNRYVQNLITYWPEIVSRHGGVNVSPLVTDYFQVNFEVGCDLVLLTGPVLAKGRMNSEELINYIENALRNVVSSTDRILVKPHPREDKNRFKKTLASTKFASQFVFLDNDKYGFENYFASLRPKAWIGMPSTVLLNRIQYNDLHGLSEKFYLIEEPNDKYPQRVRLLKKLLHEKNLI
jgi:hypothetical protein